ncbi:MAG: YqaA family protein [Pseudomonadota bacterium]
MKLFSALYDKCIGWARHRHASYYLAGLSFAESSFFPIPPDVMLAPMTLAKRDRGWFYAALTTVTSVAGGLLGYLIGAFALDMVEPLLQQYGYWEKYVTVQTWFTEWGFWAVLLAGFSPVPYKLFTIAAGGLSMSLPLFLVASAIGRGGRFFLVSGIIIWGGAAMEKKLRENVDWLGWVTILLAVVAYFIIRH